VARTAYLGLGSNVGDREGNLRAALRLLGESPGIRVRARSSVYETEPVGEVTDQRDFLNAAVAVETELAPRDLLAACKRIERGLGREPGTRHGPRPIDVDVLMVGDLVVREEGLTLPHPELAHRRFVLVPLLEIAPTLSLPGGPSLSGAHAALPTRARVERVGPLGPG
jgi:2-amino-4-hydroxy-6-hydroxymethyldihydropteridine diphosphokinase